MISLMTFCSSWRLVIFQAAQIRQELAVNEPKERTQRPVLQGLPLLAIGRCPIPHR
jgi:hypothetical protein